MVYEKIIGGLSSITFIVQPIWDDFDKLTTTFVQLASYKNHQSEKKLFSKLRDFCFLFGRCFFLMILFIKVQKKRPAVFLHQKTGEKGPGPRWRWATLGPAVPDPGKSRFGAVSPYVFSGGKKPRRVFEVLMLIDFD